MNSEGDFRGYAECLKLMLDCLPAHTAATCTTAPVTLLLQRVSPSSIDDTLTGGSSGIHANLHRRLRLVEVAVDEILSRHAAHLEHVLADTGCLDSLLEKDSEVYIQAKSQWDFNSAAQQKVAAELRSPYLQTSIRCVCCCFG